MEASTTIKQMLAGNRIFVPNYQRAYSWDTELETSKSPKQVNTFLSDLEEYNQSLEEHNQSLEEHNHSEIKSKYYFGHFLFEKKEDTKFDVIDGQQRLTTIVIFLSALFARLKQIRNLDESEQETFEDIIKRNSTYRFATVDYDNQLFKDFVIDQNKKDKNVLETESAKRIVSAFEFFTDQLSSKDELYLQKMLETVQGASCTTHQVTDESEAIQMFIFQNNRGKKPSNLEIIKAQFMFNVHLKGEKKNKDSLIDEIKNRFEKIYKSISSIEYNINEDDVLLYTLKVHFNSLWESNSIDKINKILSEKEPIPFIMSFTQSLADSFEYLMSFFGVDQRKNFEIHSLISFGNIGIAFPFIIKAYKFGLPKSDLSQLCSSLESLLIRHRVIGTRADITKRLNGVYQEFKSDNSKIKPIIDQIEWLKNVNSDSGDSYWNNEEFVRALQGEINHLTAKFLLWKYEIYLNSQGKSGYTPTRYDSIIDPELEHIAPKTDNPESGYDNYDEEFRNKYIECLGNYLLISKSHNCSIGNKPFAEKRASYTYLWQHREIQEMTKDNPTWTRDLIQKRKEKIIQFLKTNL